MKLITGIPSEPKCFEVTESMKSLLFEISLPLLWFLEATEDKSANRRILKFSCEEIVVEVSVRIPPESNQASHHLDLDGTDETMHVMLPQEYNFL